MHALPMLLRTTPMHASTAVVRTTVPPLLALRPPAAPTVASGATWLAWITYCGVVLFSEGGVAPGASALHTEPETITEALSLSLNCTRTRL